MLQLEQRTQAAPMAAHAFPLASGDRGVEQTIRAMRRLIEDGKKDPAVHEAAARILHAYNVPAFDWIGEARAIFDWVLRNIRFTRDVHGKETLHSAAEILRLRIGDCDDFTVLICSLAGTIGHKCGIVTVSSRRDDPDQFSHVYPVVQINGRWIPLDAARRTPAFGVGPRDSPRERFWSVRSDDYVDIRGLGGIAPRGGLGQVPYPPTSVAPRALPGAYRPVVNPRLHRRLRSTPFLGVGKYGAPAMRGLRGLGFDWNILGSLIQTGGQATAQIIQASRAAPFNLPVPSGPTPYSPYGAAPYSPGYVSTPFGGIRTSTMLWIGGGLVAVLLLSRR